MVAAATKLPFVHASYSTLATAHARTEHFGANANGAGAGPGAAGAGHVSASPAVRGVLTGAVAPAAPGASTASMPGTLVPGETFAIVPTDLCFLGPPLPPSFLPLLLLGQLCPRSLHLLPAWEEEQLAMACAWKEKLDRDAGFADVIRTLRTGVPAAGAGSAGAGAGAGAGANGPSFGSGRFDIGRRITAARAQVHAAAAVRASADTALAAALTALRQLQGASSPTVVVAPALGPTVSAVLSALQTRHTARPALQAVLALEASGTTDGADGAVETEEVKEVKEADVTSLTSGAHSGSGGEPAARATRMLRASADALLALTVNSTAAATSAPPEPRSGAQVALALGWVDELLEPSAPADAAPAPAAGAGASAGVDAGTGVPHSPARVLHHLTDSSADAAAAAADGTPARMHAHAYAAETTAHRHTHRTRRGAPHVFASAGPGLALRRRPRAALAALLLAPAPVTSWAPPAAARWRLKLVSGLATETAVYAPASPLAGESAAAAAAPVSVSAIALLAGGSAHGAAHALGRAFPSLAPSAAALLAHAARAHAHRAAAVALAAALSIVAGAAAATATGGGSAQLRPAAAEAGADDALQLALFGPHPLRQRARATGGGAVSLALSRGQAHAAQQLLLFTQDVLAASLMASLLPLARAPGARTGAGYGSRAQRLQLLARAAALAAAEAVWAEDSETYVTLRARVAAGLLDASGADGDGAGAGAAEHAADWAEGGAGGATAGSASAVGGKEWQQYRASVLSPWIMRLQRQRARAAAAAGGGAGAVDSRGRLLVSADVAEEELRRRWLEPVSGGDSSGAGAGASDSREAATEALAALLGDSDSARGYVVLLAAATATATAAGIDSGVGSGGLTIAAVGNNGDDDDEKDEEKEEGEDTPAAGAVRSVATAGAGTRASDIVAASPRAVAEALLLSGAVTAAEVGRLCARTTVFRADLDYAAYFLRVRGWSGVGCAHSKPSQPQQYRAPASTLAGSVASVYAARLHQSHPVMSAVATAGSPRKAHAPGSPCSPLLTRAYARAAAGTPATAASAAFAAATVAAGSAAAPGSARKLVQISSPAAAAGSPWLQARAGINAGAGTGTGAGADAGAGAGGIDDDDVNFGGDFSVGDDGGFGGYDAFEYNSAPLRRSVSEWASELGAEADDAAAEVRRRADQLRRAVEQQRARPRDLSEAVTAPEATQRLLAADGAGNGDGNGWDTELEELLEQFGAAGGTAHVGAAVGTVAADAVSAGAGVDVSEAGVRARIGSGAALGDEIDLSDDSYDISAVGAGAGAGADMGVSDDVLEYLDSIVTASAAVVASSAGDDGNVIKHSPKRARAANCRARTHGPAATSTVDDDDDDAIDSQLRALMTEDIGADTAATSSTRSVIGVAAGAAVDSPGRCNHGFSLAGLKASLISPAAVAASVAALRAEDIGNTATTLATGANAAPRAAKTGSVTTAGAARARRAAAAAEAAAASTAPTAGLAVPVLGNIIKVGAALGLGGLQTTLAGAVRTAKKESPKKAVSEAGGRANDPFSDMVSDDIFESEQGSDAGADGVAATNTEPVGAGGVGVLQVTPRPNGVSATGPFSQAPRHFLNPFARVSAGYASAEFPSAVTLTKTAWDRTNTKRKKALRDME
jgi:hypothetical protein